MKLKNIFAVALAVATLTSCDNDSAEDYPTFLGGVNSAAGVTVSLPTEFTANENEMPFQIPVTVSGQANGKVTVTVQSKQLTQVPEGLEPAIEKDHYIFTSYTVNIPAGETTGYFEVMPVWVQGELNDDRVFELSIVKVEGASVANADCQVTIANVDDPFTAMFGKWKFTGTPVYEGSGSEYTLTVSGPSTDSEYYGHELYAYGLVGRSYVFLPLNFEYDTETGDKTLSIQVATFATDALMNFGGLGYCVLLGVEGTGSVAAGFGSDIPMTYTLGEDGSETIEMTDMNQVWRFGVAPYDTETGAVGSLAGFWNGWRGIKLER